MNKSEETHYFSRLGINCKTLRKQTELTQEMLAELCGIAPRYVQCIENEYTVPSLRVLYSIARLFDITLDDLLFSKTIAKEVPDRKTKRLVFRSERHGYYYEILDSDSYIDEHNQVRFHGFQLYRGHAYYKNLGAESHFGIDIYCDTPHVNEHRLAVRVYNVSSRKEEAMKLIDILEKNKLDISIRHIICLIDDFLG